MSTRERMRFWSILWLFYHLTAWKNFMIQRTECSGDKWCWKFFLWRPRPVTEPIPRALGKQHLPILCPPLQPVSQAGLFRGCFSEPLVCMCCGFVSAWGLGGKAARVQTQLATPPSEHGVGLCVMLRCSFAWKGMDGGYGDGGWPKTLSSTHPGSPQPVRDSSTSQCRSPPH